MLTLDWLFPCVVFDTVYLPFGGTRTTTCGPNLHLQPNTPNDFINTDPAGNAILLLLMKSQGETLFNVPYPVKLHSS